MIKVKSKIIFLFQECKLSTLRAGGVQLFYGREERREFPGLIRPLKKLGSHICAWHLGKKTPSGSGMISSTSKQRWENTESPEQLAGDTCSNPAVHHQSSRPGYQEKEFQPITSFVRDSPHECSGFCSLA